MTSEPATRGTPSWYAVRTTADEVRRDAWRLLGHVVGPHPGAVLERTAAGKAILPGTGVTFSLAHHRQPGRSDAVAAVLVADGPVGVDVLACRPFSAPLRQQLAWLTGRLEDEVERMPEGECSELWTRVEAVVKQRGGTLIEEFAAGPHSDVLRRGLRDGIRTAVSWTGPWVCAAAGIWLPSGGPRWLDRSVLTNQAPSWAVSC